MSATLMALALNPNLSKEDYEQLADRHIKAQEERWNMLRDGCKELAEIGGPEAVRDYLTMAMPFMFW